MRFKMALVQMLVRGGDMEGNLARALAGVTEAAEQGSRLVLLPEAMDLGWTDPASQTEAQPIPEGRPFRLLAERAASLGVYVCAGLTERWRNRVYNSAVLIGGDGELLLIYRKLNELEIGHAFYAQGDRLGVVETELGTLGLMICADGFAAGQVISRSLGYMGAELILSPCAWAVPGDHDNQREPYGALWRDSYGPVARDFSLWIAAASNVGPIEAGPWASRRCIGCSLVVGPNGEAVLSGPYGASAEAILCLEIETRKRTERGCGWVEHWTAASASEKGAGPASL